VNVAEGDQRSMRTQEIVDAYNARRVTAETFVWKDGFSDWLPIGQVREIVDAMATASPAGAATTRGVTPAPAGYQAPAEAARREAPRGRADDLFKGGAKGDGGAVQASPPQASPRAAAGAGAKASEESSNIFSLGALTNAADAAPAPFVPSSSSSRSREDSGVIDLNALAKAQAAKAVQPAAAPAAPPQFLFPAALGQVQPSAPVFDIPEPPKRSSMPKIVTIGVVIAVGVVGVILFATHKDEPPAPAPIATTATPAPEPTPPPTASAPAPAESASPVATTTTKKTGGGGRGSGGGKKTTGGGTTVTGPTVPTAGPKRGACGCAAGDMACNIRCSATGK
jgi:hypothetical protein